MPNILSRLVRTLHISPASSAKPRTPVAATPAPEVPRHADNNHALPRPGRESAFPGAGDVFAHTLDNSKLGKLTRSTAACKTAAKITEDYLAWHTEPLDNRIHHALAAKNIEVKKNESDPSINLIVGILQHVTGIYEKSDLLHSTRLASSSGGRDLHRTEAEYFLHQLKQLHQTGRDQTLKEVDWNTPIGTPLPLKRSDRLSDLFDVPQREVVMTDGTKVPIQFKPKQKPDPRINRILTLIGEKYDLKLDATVFTRDKKSERLAETVPFRKKAQDAVQLAFLELNGQYQPLCKASFTHPALSPEHRKNRKNRYGEIQANLADVLKPARRLARGKSDIELYDHLKSIGFEPKSKNDIEYYKEWNKRSDFYSTNEGRRLAKAEENLALIALEGNKFFTEGTEFKKDVYESRRAHERKYFRAKEEVEKLRALYGIPAPIQPTERMPSEEFIPPAND